MAVGVQAKQSDISIMIMYYDALSVLNFVQTLEDTQSFNYGNRIIVLFIVNRLENL